jgi:UDP-N-acetylmuramoylalanine--D-glutamate ligase
LKGDATVVCEASSFQLEDTCCFAPEAAVLLNVSPDHLDRHANMEAYLAAKLQIFARQEAQDIAIAPASMLRSDARPPPGRGRHLGFGSGPGAEMSERDGSLCWHEQPLLEVSELRLRGRHNTENAMAAAAVCLARGLGREGVRAGLRSFAGVPHRLEEVANRGGVLFVNDSKATNVASTLVALDAFARPGARAGIHLVLGGQGKGQDFTALCGPIRRSCRAVYLIGEDAGTIAAALAGARTPLHECVKLERALAEADRVAAAGEVVLLSPACASFDQFADFEARGDRFRELLGEGGFAARASK